MQINLSSLVPFRQNYDYSNKKSCNYSNYSNLAPLKQDTVSFGNRYVLESFQKKEANEKISNAQKTLGKPFNEATNEEIFNAFGMLEQVDNDGQITLKEYSQPSDYHRWRDFGIDEKELLKNVTSITGTADFSLSQIEDLGQIKSIGGSAFFPRTLKNLGELSFIGGEADFTATNALTNLGKLKVVKGDFVFGDFRGSAAYGPYLLRNNCLDGVKVGGEVLFEYKGEYYTEDEL